ncbi:CRISPR-associated endonuclease Cas3'' [Lacticaseibacillus sp. GG6-2]
MVSSEGYIGHTSGDPIRYQSLRAHLKAAGDLAARFGAPVGLEHTCRLVGQLHDAGKYSAKFQAHIRAQDNARVNHAYAGARLLFSELHAHGWLTTDLDDGDNLAVLTLADLMANAIMAHHNADGPYDFLEPLQNGYSAVSLEALFPYYSKMQQDIPDWQLEDISLAYFSQGEMSYQEFLTECEGMIVEAKRIGSEALLKSQFYYQRFIASCLVDADHTDTANFSTKRPNTLKATNEKLCTLNEANEISVSERSQQVADNPATQQLNRDRQHMSDLSATAGDQATGLYSLSVPTGGGKTYSSLRFALHQAKAHGFEQIIYVAPYTTIIEQNAAAIRSALGVEESDLTTVLEYHSNVVVNDDQASEAYRYARDAWDAPIVVTTQVAFFNAFFGHGSKNLRHMHRTANCAIIMDEVQTLPIKLISMSNALIDWLTTAGKATVLLCTATQPDLSGRYLLQGLAKQPTEIVEDVDRVADTFARTKIVSHLTETPWTISKLDEFVDEQLNHVDSILVVLNTKGAVKRAYEGFTKEGVQTFHLSTDMCPANRQRRFERIKRNLKQNGQKVVVFSTRLIEAGVDLSFQMAIRSLAGLDSVVQTAGRCNRNHELPMGTVHLISIVKSAERMGSLKTLTVGMETTKEVAALNPEADLSAPKIVKSFFQRYYAQFDRNKVTRYPYQGSLMFEWGHVTAGLKLVNNERFNAVASSMDVLSNHGPVRSYGLVSAAPQSIAKHFEVIDSPTTPVIVAYDPNTDVELGELQSSKHVESGTDIITALLSNETSFDKVPGLLQRAQAFTVQVYNLDQLGNIGYIDIGKHGGVYYTMNYDSDTGITADSVVGSIIL